MKVREFISECSDDILIVFKKKNDPDLSFCKSETICITSIDSEGIEPYLDRYIIEWGIQRKLIANNIGDIYIKLADKDKTED